MKTELAIEIPTRVIEKRRYFEISGTWNEARGVMPDTRVRKKVSTFWVQYLILRILELDRKILNPS